MTDTRTRLEDVPTVPALRTLRRGLGSSPELRSGLGFTVALALIAALGRLLIPFIVQRTIDDGLLGPDGFRGLFVYSMIAIGALLVVLLTGVTYLTLLRLSIAAEKALASLRTRAFAHIHRLSIADHHDVATGALTARVTSDVETLGQFATWGAISWIVEGSLLVGTFVVMAIYSWQLTAVVIFVFLPLLPILRWVQKRQLVAYIKVRDKVGETLGITSEAVLGADVIRAYGYRAAMRVRLGSAIDEQYRAQLRSHRFFAWMMPVTDMFGAVALAATVGVGVWWGPGWGLSAGELVAFLFLVNMALGPIAELGEVLDQTQTAIAGWAKILHIFDVEVEVEDPSTPRPLSAGQVAIRAVDVDFAYRTGAAVLHSVSLDIPAGASVAIVGETGSGKTTFAKLLCRLADPTRGAIELNGVDLRSISAEDRHRSVRMVPQDGFLFSTTVRENIRYGKPDATDDDVDAAFVELGLDSWIARLPDGADSSVGERGSALSVGERQLVALVRAQLADPGLLILDEATSAVDPETEQALNQALAKLSLGRTTVAIAHRLSTAEQADLIVVFDAGEIAEVGNHLDLVHAGGIYAGLHESWLGNTRQAQN
jgi:ATP-binding cassette subfamily B protein